MLPFAAAILLGAFLLFLVQPMAAKLLLPRLGGSPAVWNACMLFFQTALLGGYAYAHALTSRLKPAGQAAVHAALVALPLLVLPLAIPAASEPPPEGSPVAWLLGALALSVGLPFFALSTTGPLLQRWFSHTSHPKAADPYFLYAASNTGSLAALVAYPLLIEPALRLQSGPGITQTRLFSAGYVVYAVLAAACGVLAWRRRGPSNETRSEAPAIAWRRGAFWVLLAFVPASASLGVTQYLTTDIAVFPLLWVIPLAVYLSTFILAFSSAGRVPGIAWSRLLGVLAVAAVAVFWIFFRAHPLLLVVLHPLLLFAIGMVCHGRLAADRPPASQLTAFYFLIALGGMLGGVFNTLVAPALFTTVAEYPLVILAAVLLTERSPGPVRRWVLATPLAAVAGILLLPELVSALGWNHPVLVYGTQAVVPCLVALVALGRPWVLGLSVAVLFAGAYAQTRIHDTTILRDRTFFGVLRVTLRDGPPFRTVDAGGKERVFTVPYHTLVHGNTRHGMQALDPRWRRTPNTYFHASGPIGQVFAAFDRDPRLDRVAVIGLGIGTLAAYGKPGREFTFYEIDPEVIRIARTPRYFTYLDDSASTLRFVPGDGRLSIAKAPDGAYGLIVLDAFSSDAIPAHLLTREAVELYLRKLRPDGILAFHLTNQSLDLPPVVDAIAADLGLSGLVQTSPADTPQELLEAKDESTWTVLARDREALGVLAVDPRWAPIPDPAGASHRRRYLWTDDYTNLWGVIKLD